MKIKDVVHALEMFAPLPLQESYDNAGLQVGLTDAKITGALLCLDVTEDVMDEAIRKGCNLVVSHHPLMFKGYKSFTGRDYVERCVMKAIKHDIAVYTMHTNIDNAPYGVSHVMAERLGLKKARVLEPKEKMLFKLAVFVPCSHASEVRQALFSAGCGHIGAYDQCSYNTEGYGTFRASAQANPYCGTIGEAHREPEVKVEVILPAYLKAAVEQALKTVHPYEEPAYDFYELQNTWTSIGSGVVGELDTPMSEQEFLLHLKSVFAVGAVKHSSLRGKTIRRVALCGGSGGFLLPLAARSGADVYVTGEVKYHDYFFYQDRLLIADIGHYESEQYTPDIFCRIIKGVAPQLKVIKTELNTNPIKYL